MDQQKTAMIIHALEKGRALGGAEAKRVEIANAFRSLQIILFDCFKSEYKPGVSILLGYSKSPDSSPEQLIEAIATLGEHRMSEITYSARELLLLASFDSNV